ncbi:MAG: glycosidase [Clostridia bacterium]|nr:glycosidase [Clostridia bacterium]MDD4666214.1 glycosidase [Clostridia bacterium]
MNDYFEHKNTNTLFQRYKGNPILIPARWPYLANATFNPGAIKHHGESLLLVRVENMCGFSHLTIARSKDGKTNWQIEEKPFLAPKSTLEEEQWGLEDPRIVWLEDRQEYAITYVCFSKDGPTVSLALTKDFETVERQGRMLPPEDKDASLFPRKINDRYVLIHRPIIRGEAHIWISFSPDLKYWGDHRILLPVRPGWWDCSKVGLGPPPIETREGWLIIYHGVRTTASGSLYRVGLALLDLDEPWKIIRRSSHWVFGPQVPYERVGDVPGVTFPTGIIVNEESRELRMYYGAADSNVSLAIANIDELVEYILNCPEENQ